MTAPAALLAVCLAGLVMGGVLRLLGLGTASDTFWLIATAVASVASAWWVLQGLRNGEWGVDVIALLALVGSALVGELAAGAIIAVMFTGGGC